MSANTGKGLRKRRRNKPKRQQPDDHFTCGPIDFTRFGNMVVGKSRATAEQLASVHTKLAERFPVVVAEIDALVGSIAAQVARLPPDKLLQRGWWEYAMAVMRFQNAKLPESNLLHALRMIDYIQSVIVAVQPQAYAEHVSEDDWKRLKSDVGMLFQRLTSEYQICLTARRKVDDPGLDMELEEFRMRAELLWMNIRGKRYQVHERQALLDVIRPHSDVLVRLFRIDAEPLVGELDKILSKLTLGLTEAASAFQQFREDVLGRLETLYREHPDLDMAALRDKMFEDEDLAARRDSVMGALFGLDLFDVGKNTTLPPEFLAALSWSPGECTEFFGPGEFRGLPLRIWPTMQRPFIRIDDQVLCFDVFSLFDNFYRVLRRLILSREPEYANTWNERQKAISEELPFICFSRLLPGAVIYRPVYYSWAPAGGRVQRYEADGLVIFEDHLLVIEVKAGAFTYTSPANDLPAHLASLRNLLQAPAHQGSRFVNYLQSAEEVSIEDAEQREIGRIRHRDFRQITVCAVTLDAFTSLAARAQRFAPLGVDLGPSPVWPISIDDLRIYAEIFDNPLTFLHYVEQRTRASQSQHLDLNDEMDHLGLYLTHNNYSQYAAELTSGELRRLAFTGYTSPIDEYFRAVLIGETPSRPQQAMPDRLEEVIAFLAGSNEPRRAELVSILLNAAGHVRESIDHAIDEALRGNKELRRARPLSIYGGMAMTLYVWSPYAPRHAGIAIQHTQAVMMAASNESSRGLIELEYTENGVLTGAHLTHVRIDELSVAESEEIRKASLVLQEKRLTQARALRKIGRNEPCPCGSGAKYKRCHGR